MPFAGAAPQGSKGDHAHWHRRHQHYVNLAENAGGADRVDRENYWQHAEHFFRLISEADRGHRQPNGGTAAPAPLLRTV